MKTTRYHKRTIAGRPWREHTVFAAMAAIETAARKSPSFPLAPEI